MNRKLDSLQIGFKITITLSVAVIPTFWESTAQSQRFDEIVVFGDSMSDTGNWWIGADSPAWSYGGRFSNGPVWVEELATQLGLPLPELSRAGGTNYAWGGSPTGWGADTSEGYRIPRIGWQVARFSLRREPNPNRLIVIHGGGNDFGRLFEQDPSVPASNLAAHISDLASLGEQHFLVPSLIPLGYAPGFLRTSFEEPMNAIIAEFNRLLAIELDDLEDQLGITIYRADQYGLGLEAIENPSAFGLTNITDQAWNGGDVVPNPDEYLFWDEFHYTTAFHRFLGQQAALAVVPEPTACVLLLVAVIGAVCTHSRHVQFSHSFRVQSARNNRETIEKQKDKYSP